MYYACEYYGETAADFGYDCDTLGDYDYGWETEIDDCRDYDYETLHALNTNAWNTPRTATPVFGMPMMLTPMQRKLTTAATSGLIRRTSLKTTVPPGSKTHIALVTKQNTMLGQATCIDMSPT